MTCNIPDPAHPLPVRRRPAPCPDRLRATRTDRQLCRLTQLVAEVLAGQRSPDQMRALLSRGAYTLLVRRSGIYACTHSPRVRRTFLRREEPEVAEVNAVIDCGSRYRALALRVAFGAGSWLCTHLETDVGRG